jgi:hypothetical protein
VLATEAVGKYLFAVSDPLSWRTAAFFLANAEMASRLSLSASGRRCAATHLEHEYVVLAARQPGLPALLVVS